MNPVFPTDYLSILKRVDEVDPIEYGKSRNYINGAVTYLSPYISRGVISTKQVLHHVLEKGYPIHQIQSILKELCWRDYFQRVGQHKNLRKEIRQPQEVVLNNEIPMTILTASTGIEGIDNAIYQLYETGYMHNHCRMYTAALVCNIAKSHWENPADWMYYHLLDGDFASNACSWQWVAGANSSKKYFANQENINRFSSTNQVGTFLDSSYEEIATMEIPVSLLQTHKFVPEVYLPQSNTNGLNEALPTYIYNYYNLDPLWHKDEPGNRILLLEPEFFAQYPVSKKCIDFMLALSENIPNIRVFTGSFQTFCELHHQQNIHFKEHPLNVGYLGTEEPRDWISDGVSGYYPSFFGYWKKVEMAL